MSETVLRLVPADPQWQPDPDDAERARALLAEIIPDADSVGLAFEKEPVFFDAGANMEAISCPDCGADAEPWWGDAMSAAFEGGFGDLSVTTPCCGARTSLNDLRYRWPAAFGRFALEATNPGKDGLTADERAAIEGALGSPLRLVCQHL